MDLDWDNIDTEQLEKSSLDTTSYEDEWEYVDEIVDEEDENPTINEAIKRIEQAKLYELLLKHDFFAPGSARKEIQSKVTSEIRDFILERLTVLVGIKQPAEVAETTITPTLPWNESQIQALTSIANRLVDKKEQTTTNTNRPAIQPFSGSEVNTPKINQTAPIKEEASKQKTRRVKKRKEQNKQPTEAIKKPQENPVSENGITLYKGQVVSKVAKKMPTQVEIDMINNRQAQRNASGSGTVGDKLLGMAITQAQNINSNT